jgi:sugar lactone lactonase YvrE
MSAAVFDHRPCVLGEGPLWHPLRDQLFWFDIISKRLLSVKDGMPKSWSFGEHVSAAGWTGRDSLLIASETALFHFDLNSHEIDSLVELEADDAATRSNDGRADPWGGFWIGTMGKAAQPRLGAIYRWHRGNLVKLFDKITISNAICFSPDRRHAYFTDTPTRRIMRQTLDSGGWPKGDPDLFIDLSREGLNPDGAVVDAEGHLWNAQWGASRVARYDTRGTFVEAVAFPAIQTSCPAFGGPTLDQLYVTSASEGLSPKAASDGQTFVQPPGVRGQPEHKVKI